MGATLKIILFAWILLLGSLPGSFAHAPAKITARSLPQAIRGEADPNATITISPPAAVSRYGRDAGNTGPFFSAYVTRPVASTNAFISITNKASRPPMANVPAVSATNITQVYIPTNNYITYDEAGNTKSDGRWVYSWDAYNRLTKVESKPGAPVDSMRSLSFTYDAFGRRIGRVVSVADANGVYQESDYRKYVYHGWKLVAELNGTNNAVIRSYAWAQNMLLAIRQANRTYIPTFDGNGNVMTLVDNQTGAIAARYEYSPYGMLLKATGPMAMENPIRYSSEYQDDVTGFIYYGYRYLNPATQTWLSRDPIGMAGGFNLYALVDNDPVNGRDELGLSSWYWYLNPFFYLNGMPEDPSDLPPTDSLTRNDIENWRQHLRDVKLENERKRNEASMRCGVIWDQELEGNMTQGLAKLAKTIADDSYFILDFTPQAGFSVWALNEEMDGSKPSLVSRAAAAPSSIYLAGKVFKVSGRVLKKLSGKSAEEIEKILAKQAEYIGEGKSANCASSVSQALHGHHAYMKALGGDPKQKLAYLLESEHLLKNGIHSDLAKFESGWLRPRKGMTGADIVNEFGTDEVEEGLRRFYSQPKWRHLLPSFEEAVRFTHSQPK